MESGKNDHRCPPLQSAREASSRSEDISPQNASAPGSDTNARKYCIQENESRENAFSPRRKAGPKLNRPIASMSIIGKIRQIFNTSRTIQWSAWFSNNSTAP
jgi:hypothetical protein